MSRIGNRELKVPANVTVEVNDNNITEITINVLISALLNKYEPIYPLNILATCIDTIIILYIKEDFLLGIIWDI